MPNIDEGITNEEPQHDVNTDEGFRRHLEAQAGGADLIHSRSEWGAPGSAHRKAKVASEMAEGQRKADAQVASLADFQAIITAPGAGNVQGGLELPDDTPAPTPAAPSPEATAQLEALQAQLVTTKASLSEAQAHEALQVARDSLEESMDETDVHNTLSILKSELSKDDFAGFTMESLGDGLLDPDELATFNEVWESERAFEDAFDRSASAQAAADALKESQLLTLEGEQKRLGLSNAEYTLHVQDMAEAAAQMGLDFDQIKPEDYAEEIQRLGALVAEARRAYASAAVQEQILYDSGGTNVESGLSVMGVPVTPREPIEPRLDFARAFTHLSRGKPFNIAKGVMEEDRQARSKGEDIEKAYRAAKRAQDEREARASRSMGL